jgi:hypothetical protein
MSQFALRPVDAGDLDAMFEQMRDPEAVRMAALTPEDPNDRGAFDAHVAKVVSSSANRLRAIICDSRLVGTNRELGLEGVPPNRHGGVLCSGRAAEIEETILELR